MGWSKRYNCPDAQVDKGFLNCIAWFWWQCMVLIGRGWKVSVVFQFALHCLDGNALAEEKVVPSKPCSLIEKQKKLPSCYSCKWSLLFGANGCNKGMPRTVGVPWFSQQQRTIDEKSNHLRCDNSQVGPVFSEFPLPQMCVFFLFLFVLCVCRPYIPWPDLLVAAD